MKFRDRALEVSVLTIFLFDEIEVEDEISEEVDDDEEDEDEEDEDDIEDLVVVAEKVVVDGTDNDEHEDILDLALDLIEWFALDPVEVSALVPLPW